MYVFLINLFNKQKKIFFFLLFVFILLLPCFSEVKKDDKTKDEDKKVKIDLSSKITGSVGIRDKDDSTGTDIGLAKNTPEICKELDLFTRIIIQDKKKFIIGPYFESEINLRFDNRNDDETRTFLERHYGMFDTGIKLGYDFGEDNFKDSYFIFNIPFSIYNKLLFNDTNHNVIIPDNNINSLTQNTDLTRFHTSLLLGTRLGFKLHLKIKKQYMRFNFEDYVSIQGETLSGNYTQDYSGIFIENENIVEYKIAPFNFINNKIDIWLNFYNRFFVYYDSYNIGLKNKAYLEIAWTGFKYLHVGYKPIQYRFRLKIPKNDIFDAYDQLHKISMEVWISAGYNFFWATLSYEPTIYALDAPVVQEDINIDSIKPHVISMTIEFKI